ncbi:YggS family pyridoxal phosphate-dependent enzyme [Candidatus Ishikawella capsulata]|uniref:Pyridoxal phosphate homeostasis protein n=1 Tax=Candidatus Ishikawaella capsulata Mpkobe TaxID=476281 RepID=C5WDJ8_9ENTR|nr:YggS family pyridoxal phosphate-dependent enzyme [Candidatus Ishikawaella capsulata]BAH83404.1 predicted enzyme [Candidatus Ishikawaella capsulata Mpkobe]
MISIKENLNEVRNQIMLHAIKYQRHPKDIKLLAVSKNKSISEIKEAIKFGQRFFGENYVQEAIKKIQQLNNFLSVEWHFIGTVQSNKSRLVAENFTWCHTINSLKIAQRLNDQRPTYLPPLNVLIQINISGEDSKSGVDLNILPTLAKVINNNLPYLKLRGLMTIPAREKDYKLQFSIYQKMSKIFHSMKLQYPDIDTLSLGMSDDMAAAIAAGSTLLRIGTAIFGSRDK